MESPTVLVWVHKGTRAGNFINMPPEEAEQAEAEGWAQAITHPDVKAEWPDKSPHPQADAYYARPAGGYATREMRADAPPDLKPPRKIESDRKTPIKAK